MVYDTYNYGLLKKNQWIGFVGNIFTGNHGFYHQNPSNIGVSCKCSHHPVLWKWQRSWCKESPGFFGFNGINLDAFVWDHSQSRFLWLGKKHLSMGDWFNDETETYYIYNILYIYICIISIYIYNKFKKQHRLHGLSCWKMVIDWEILFPSPCSMAKCWITRYQT